MADSLPTSQKIIEISLKYDKVINGLEEAKRKIEELDAAKKKLDAEQKDPATAKSVEEYRKQSAAIKESRKAVEESARKLSRELQGEIGTMTNAAGSINQMRSKLNNLRAQYDSLSKAMRKSDFGRNMQKQIQDLNKEISKAEQATGRFQRNVGNYASAFKGLKMFLVQAGLGFTTLGQAVVGFGNAIKDGINTVIVFNREASRLQAILKTTKDDVQELTHQARQLGATTRYTATEVVSLQVELAKLGYMKGQILNMTESILHLAQATGSSLADAAALAGAALRIFGDTSRSTTMYVDQIATATAKSALSFDYIKTALPIVGGAAQMFGFTLQDVLTLLGMLANSGMEASMAATATRNIFLKLADSNGVLAKQLGKPVKNLEDLLNGLAELKARGADLNDALEMTNVRSAVAFTRFLNSTEAARKLNSQLNWTGKRSKDAAKGLEEVADAANAVATASVDTQKTVKKTIDEVKRVSKDANVIIPIDIEFDAEKKEQIKKLREFNKSVAEIQNKIEKSAEKDEVSVPIKLIPEAEDKTFDEKVSEIQERIAQSTNQSSEKTQIRILPEIEVENKSFDKQVEELHNKIKEAVGSQGDDTKVRVLPEVEIEAPKFTNEQLEKVSDLYVDASKGVDKMDYALAGAAKSEHLFGEEAETASKKVNGLDKSIEDCTGSAEDMAKIMDENLGGDLKMLSSRWDEFMIALQNGQGPLRIVVQWLTSIVEKLGLMSRSIEFSLDIKTDEDLQDLQNNLLAGYLKMDEAKYRGEFKKFYDEYIKQGMSASEATAKAEIEARESVIRFLEKEKDIRKSMYEGAKKERENTDDKLWYAGWSKLTKLNLQELEEKAKTSYGEELKMINLLLDAMKKEAKAKADMLLIDSRIEEMQNPKKTEQPGIGIEDDAARRKRLEKEKQAAKDLLNAKKAYNKAVIDQTRELDDAILLDYDATARQILDNFNSALEEGIEKQEAILREKYEAEIESLRVKIQEEERLLQDATANEAEMRSAAIEVYNKTIDEKTRDLETSINRLNIEYIKKSVGYVEEQYRLRLEAVVKGSTEEIRVREDMLDLQYEREIAELELRATKDARIEKELADRKALIYAKYQKLRLDIRKEAIQQEMKLIQNDFEISILGAYNDDIQRTRLEHEKEVAILDGIVRERELMSAELDNAYKDRLTAEEAYQMALKTGSEQEIEEARKVAEEKAQIHEQMLSEYENSDSDYQKRIAEQESKVRSSYAAKSAAETAEKIRPFEFDVIHADNELEKLRAQMQLANAIRDNMRREDYENDLEFINAKLQAERNYVDAVKALADKEFQIRTSAANAISNMFSVVSGAIKDTMDENQENVRLQKILSLASVYLAQGVAIANAIRDASQSSSSVYEMVAQIAVGIATVVTSTKQAFDSIKAAKFAKGVVNLQGPGTATSDSIPARLSRGESVMTAKATQMFGGLLTIMNEIAAQPHVTLPTMYSQYNPTQTRANSNEQSRVFRDAVREIRPVVSVKEITDVKTRVEAIEQLDTF